MRTNEARKYHDTDDDQMLSFGHSTGPPYLLNIISIVKRYYAAAAAGEGTSACFMLYAPLAQKLEEEKRPGSGLAYLHGSKVCGQVAARLFKHHHNSFVGPAEVTGVRVLGNEGRALLGSKVRPAGFIRVRDERGEWKVDQLIGSTLP